MESQLMVLRILYDSFFEDKIKSYLQIELIHFMCVVFTTLWREWYLQSDLFCVLLNVVF